MMNKANFLKGKPMINFFNTVQKYVRDLFAEPKGTSAFVCLCFSAFFGFIGLLWVILALGCGSTAGLVAALMAMPLWIAGPFYFYRFYREMIKGVFNKRYGREERARQVKGFKTLPFYKTFRGQAVGITWLVFIMTFLFGLFVDNYIVLMECALMIPMIFLMCRGYNWIYVFAILWWTAEKFLQARMTLDPVYLAGIAVWWIVVTYIYLQAFKVGRAYHKTSGYLRLPWLLDIVKALCLLVVAAVIIFTFIYSYLA